VNAASPNIVIILADDFGVGDIQAHNGVAFLLYIGFHGYPKFDHGFRERPFGSYRIAQAS